MYYGLIIDGNKSSRDNSNKTECFGHKFIKIDTSQLNRNTINSQLLVNQSNKYLKFIITAATSAFVQKQNVTKNVTKVATIATKSRPKYPPEIRPIIDTDRNHHISAEPASRCSIYNFLFLSNFCSRFSAQRKRKKQTGLLIPQKSQFTFKYRFSTLQIFCMFAVFISLFQRMTTYLMLENVISRKGLFEIC